MTRAVVNHRKRSNSKARMNAANAANAAERRFDWPLCYAAENFISDQIQSFLRRSSTAAKLSENMRVQTGTLFMDWVDCLELAPNAEATLRRTGFAEDPFAEDKSGSRKIFWHPDAMLPRVAIDPVAPSSRHPQALAIRVDCIVDFMATHGTAGEPEGKPFSRYRRITISNEKGARFVVVERRGYRGFIPDNGKPAMAEAIVKARELWRTRPRSFSNDADGFHETQTLLDRVLNLVGRDLACHVVFAEERTFWERRNRAAQIQKRRQDKLGLGWANHDHHTFRCSRRHFVDLMRILEKLGFERRERYYAGAQAGWGAQILEQPVEGIVAFCDVDLEPAETEIDFSRQVLPPPKKLGTIGLWVGLHGESILDAGMHHLECRFDHDQLREQLVEEGVNTMKPFSDLPFLKQAFTEGERWTVSRKRAKRLLRNGLIDEDQFDRFTSEGAIGSHLENLQRKGGFKGFNQKSVSVIIQATDPRRQGRNGSV